MFFHHDKHFSDYTNKLNAYVKGTKMEGLTIIDLMTQFTSDQTVRHMAGGFHNHC